MPKKKKEPEEAKKESESACGAKPMPGVPRHRQHKVKPHYRKKPRTKS